MKSKLFIIFFLTIIFVTPIHAGELDAWEFKFFGINTKDFKNRDWKPMIVGAVASFVVHEAGHYIAGELTGMDSSFDLSQRAVLVDDYDDKSNDRKALFHAGGFISQVLVGGILTAIPSTRHSDFTVGFNGWSTVNGFYYGITDGTQDESLSDTKNLDEYGYDGTIISLTSGTINGIFTYININKEK